MSSNKYRGMIVREIRKLDYLKSALDRAANCRREGVYEDALADYIDQKEHVRRLMTDRDYAQKIIRRRAHG